MYEIKAVVRAERLEDIVRALHAIPGLPGVTVSIVRGIGRRQDSQKGNGPEYGDVAMAKLETVVPDELVDRVIATVRQVGHTGRAGDGKIFVSDVRRAINIRDDGEGVEIL
jgi:nitrogen regulatory protein P-II 1